MKRRTVIASLGILAACPWPLAHAQRNGRIRRVAVLMLYPEADPAGQGRATAFRQELQKLGWTTGKNIEIDFRWGTGDADWIRAAARDILKKEPEVILANGGASIRPVQDITRTVPTVFIGGADPVQDGVVKSLAKPGGNITGFSNLEPSVGAKLLSLLREIAPDVKRAAVMFNPDNSGTARLTQSAIDAAKSFGVEAVSVPIRGPQDVERAMSVQAAETHTGFIVPPDPLINFQRKLIVELAGRRRLPAIHALRSATAEGGLISYGVDIPDLFRKSAAYVDRILRGEKPGDLPVQQPTKFELVINLKTARELGLNVPQALMVAADEIIQ